MTGPGQTLFGFVRHWSRRSTADPAMAEHGRIVLVCEAVHSLTEREVAATVNAIAHEVGIDQSGASRLMKQATSAGYLVMAASPADGRRRQAALTRAGHTMLAQAHRWQESVFERLTTDWSEQQRYAFQRAMTDLVERSYTLDPAPGRPDPPAR